MTDHPHQGKPWWQSKTVAGATTAIIASIISMVGTGIDEATAAEIATQLTAAAGGALAIYGRVHAKGPLGR